MNEENHPRLVKKEVIKVRIQNPLVIFVVRKEILLMCTRERMSISMTNLKPWVTIISAISKDIRHMNARLKP